jgi:signal transduction histidine kinase
MEKKTTILYIDDDHENLTGFAVSFSRHFLIYTAMNTLEGYDILRQGKINLVLVDYKMPKEDGISFVERIRDEFPDLVFLIVSAYADLEVVIQALNMNCFFGFVQKPWDFHELKVTLQNAEQLYWTKIENRQLTASLEEKNQELQLSLSREQEANKVKTIFLQNISHEIRTPLNAIIGFSSMLQIANDMDKVKYYASFINQGGTDLLKTLQSILDISMIFSHQLQYNCCEGSVQDVVERAISLTPKPKDEIRLFNTIDGNCHLLNDISKITQVLQILIGNAIKFTYSGTIDISVIGGFESNTITFKVSDTGVGVAPDKFEQIFLPFRQSEESLSRSFGGIGSGLFIAKTYVEFLEGKIWVESELGKGSTFFFTVAKNLQPAEKKSINY